MKPASLPSIAKLLAVVVLGAAFGVAVSTAWKSAPVQTAWHHLAGAAATPALPAAAGLPAGWADNLQARPVVQLQPAPATPARRVVAAAPARVATQLVVAGTAHPADAWPVALPSGTRLQVRLTPNRSGRLELHAINPQGEHSGQALWTTAATAGRTVQSPALRLQGQRGMETLQVVLRHDNGSVLLRDEVQLWHQ